MPIKNHLLIGVVLLLSGVAHAAAPAAQLTANASERAKVLKEQIKTFRIDLQYRGDQEKPYYRLTLSVAPIGVKDSSPFWLRAQIDESQAGKIIDHLASEGFLDQAVDGARKGIPAPPTPCYTLTVWSGDAKQSHEFYAVLGWGLPMLKRLDGLRTALERDAAGQMDLLLGRLSGHRKEWAKQASPAAPEATGRGAVIATGDWSDPVDDDGYRLRGRLVLAEGRTLRDGTIIETVVYVELMDVSDAVGNSMEIFFDGDHGGDFRKEHKGGLDCELHDSLGKPVSESPFFFSGGIPSRSWITLPPDCSIRLRASCFGVGREKDAGIAIALPGHHWLIPPNNPAPYFLSGTFSVVPPANHASPPNTHLWKGTLTLPRMRITPAAQAAERER